MFNTNGTVSWHDASTKPQAPPKEQPKYAVEQIDDGILLVSYLSSSGYTLTFVLNFKSDAVVGFASNDKEWHPVKGTFYAVG